MYSTNSCVLDDDRRALDVAGLEIRHADEARESRKILALEIREACGRHAHHFFAASCGVAAVSPRSSARRSSTASMLLIGRSTSASAGSAETCTVWTLFAMPPSGT